MHTRDLGSALRIPDSELNSRNKHGLLPCGPAFRAASGTTSASGAEETMTSVRSAPGTQLVGRSDAFPIHPVLHFGSESLLEAPPQVCVSRPPDQSARYLLEFKSPFLLKLVILGSNICNSVNKHLANKHFKVTSYTGG